jgi:hypothetical protein
MCAWCIAPNQCPCLMSIPPCTATCRNAMTRRVANAMTRRVVVTGWKQGIGGAAEEASWRIADPSRYPKQVCRGLVQLLLREQVNSAEAQWLAKQIGSRLPPGWGATWTERGFGELTGTRDDQRQLVVSYLGAMEVGCVGCQVRYRGTC